MSEERKTALITGASSGIGQGIALVLAEEGYDVAITYGENAEGAENTRQQVEAMGRKCVAIQASLHEDNVAERTVNKAVAELGRLDLLVCNAGRTRHESVLTINEERLDWLYNLNYRAYIVCAGAAARHMVLQGIKGNIIFISSTHSYRAYPHDFLYGGLKAALNRSAESLALDLAPFGIRVNCIAPGATQVRPKQYAGKLEARIPLPRLGTPAEIGYLVSFLASEKAGYITGVTVKADGGLILPGMPEGVEDYKYERGWGRPDIPANLMELMRERVDDPEQN